MNFANSTELGGLCFFLMLLLRALNKKKLNVSSLKPSFSNLKMKSIKITNFEGLSQNILVSFKLIGRGVFSLWKEKTL